jgi:hypothetical protein
MPRRDRNHIDDLRGATRLAVEATQGVTALVQAMHQEIAGGPSLLGRPLDAPARFVIERVYGHIRGVTGLVGAGIDLALGQLAPLVGVVAPGPEREAVLAAINGVLGDYLAATGNPLAIEMRLRHEGQPLELERSALRAALPRAGGRLLVLAHGSSLTDLQWARRGHDHGVALSRDLGMTPIHLLYNSGLHVSTIGRSFSLLLEQLVAEWPAPLEELVILAHSMGGLVARSACHAAEAAGHAWRARLGKLVFLGTPHHGAPLGRAGKMVDVLLGVSRYSAPLARLGKIRSAGVTDLRHGNVLDEHWQGRDRFAPGADSRAALPLPDGVSCHAIAGTLSPAPGGRLRSDGLVPVDSALGRHANAALSLAFAEKNQRIAYHAGHLDLLGRAEVYETIHGWLAA